MRKLKLLSLAVIALSLSACGNPSVDSPLISSSGNPELIHKDKTIVMFFWYGCPHCYKVHGEMLKKNTPGVSVEYVAVPGNEIWTKHAQHFYTMKRMGLLPDLSDSFFDMVQAAKSNPSNSEIDKFFESHKVSIADYHKVFDSAQVQKDLEEASKLAKQYKINGVPAIYADGDHRLEMERAASYADIPKALDSFYSSPR